jgi:hypothetical protein
MQNPFRTFNISPEVIRLAVMMYAPNPLSPRLLEDLLFERGIDICHQTVRFRWNRFGSRRRSGNDAFIVFTMALAPGRGVRQDQWRDT